MEVNWYWSTSLCQCHAAHEHGFSHSYNVFYTSNHLLNYRAQRRMVYGWHVRKRELSWLKSLHGANVIYIVVLMYIVCNGKSIICYVGYMVFTMNMWFVINNCVTGKFDAVNWKHILIARIRYWNSSLKKYLQMTMTNLYTHNHSRFAMKTNTFSNYSLLYILESSGLELEYSISIWLNAGQAREFSTNTQYVEICETVYCIICKIFTEIALL